jgi:hypothetical protein
LNEDKSKYAGLAQEQWFWLSIIPQFAVASKRQSNNVHLRKKGVILLLLGNYDWLIIIIGPGGLLLVIPSTHLFAVPVSILWAGFQKINN